MQLFLSKLVSSIVQLILFTAVPFIWWVVSARKKETFFHWLGLKKVEGGERIAVVKYSLLAAVALAIVSVGLLIILKDVATATSDFDGKGIGALPAALVYAVFNTALPEEILFRGFLLKRLSAKLGFETANILQALVFGLIHGAMLISLTGALNAVAVILFTAAVGATIGTINERKAGGSILPGWGIHSLANLFCLYRCSRLYNKEIAPLISR